MARKILIGALLLAAPAHADNTLLFGGAEASAYRSAYGQVGIVQALPGSTLGDGWAVRGVADGLTYKYKGAPGTVKADALGGQLTAGYISSGAPGWWSFFSGPVYRYTDLSPEDYSSKARGGDWGWIVQGEAERKLSQDFKINLAGNYVFAGNDAFWTRVRLLYRVDGEIYAGPEGTYQGDSDYNAWSVGAGVFGIQLDKTTLFGVKAGIRKTENFNAAPYGGFEIGRSF